MRLLLLAISSASAPPFALAADEHGSLIRVTEGQLSAWAVAAEPHASAPGRAELMAQHALVSRLHERADGVLPARFPTWTDEAVLRAHLRRQSANYGDALARVEGRVELAVTALWTDTVEAPFWGSQQPDESIAPGTRYLWQRQQAFAASDRRRAAAIRLAEDLEQTAGEALAESQRQVCPSANVALSLALLVARASAPDVQVGLLRARAGLRILVNGPWPPYTFAAVEREV